MMFELIKLPEVGRDSSLAGLAEERSELFA